MTAATDRICLSLPLATDGEIAAINLQSARRRAWMRFTEDPSLFGNAEKLFELEHLTAQFLGDPEALDRLKTLASQFTRADSSYRSAVLLASVCSILHRFDEARAHLVRVANADAPADEIERLTLTIDHACSARLGEVYAARKRIAETTGRTEDLIPFAALLADLERFDEAHAVYRRAIQVYDGVSPFPLAWACFQLGMLWGEVVPCPDLHHAAYWYRRAVSYLPGYVKARIHLAEICSAQGKFAEAESLLLPALANGDPEVPWRLADALEGQGRSAEAETQLEAARIGFEALIETHPLAFADHAAEFFAGSGNDIQRALELARMNVLNRPTRRAIAQTQAIARRYDAIGTEVTVPCLAAAEKKPTSIPVDRKQ
jgi:tetratricopeptide (TPR) repeat protein